MEKVLAYDGKISKHSLAHTNLTVGDNSFQVKVMTTGNLAAPVFAR